MNSSARWPFAHTWNCSRRKPDCKLYVFMLTTEARCHLAVQSRSLRCDMLLAGSMHAECPASKTKPQSSLSHTNLQSLQSIPEEQPELQSCSRVGAASTSVQAQASALLREKFPEPTQYIASSLQHRSPQGSCDLPTVFSGQLMMPVL